MSDVVKRLRDAADQVEKDGIEGIALIFVDGQPDWQLGLAKKSPDPERDVMMLGYSIYQSTNMLQPVKERSN